MAAVIASVLLAGCSLLTGPDDSISPPGAAGASPWPTPSPEPASLARFYTQQPQWRACGNRLRCAEILVPIDYAQPTGPTLKLAVNRRPAGEPSERVGALVVNPGGPGVSGLSYAVSLSTSLPPTVLKHFDVVGFDPRGVGSSTPVDCVTDVELARLLDSESTPDTASEVVELKESLQRFREGCQQRSGELLAHVETLNVARDLDVLRAVVGDQRLTYLGKSYGTSIGTRYAQLFPQRVGRMVLDGVVDPSVREPDLSLRTAVAFEQALSRFAEWCVSRSCRLGPRVADVLSAVDDVMESADALPIATSGRRPLSGTSALYGVLLPLYLAGDSGYAALAQAVGAAREGDGSVLLRLADTLLGRTSNGSFTSNLNEAIVAVNCRDRGPEVSVDEVADLLPRFDRAAPRFGAALAWSTASCAYWPQARSGSEPLVVSATLPPFMIVGTLGDPATPYEWATGLAERIPSANLLTWTGSGHTAYLQGSECVDEAVGAYLLRGELPTAGKVCD